MAKDGMVEPLLPVRLGRGGLHYARGVRAGNWIFATGQLAQDFENGIAPSVLSLGLPHGGAPKREKEAARIFDNLAEVLEAGGGEFDDVVRTDQYYTTYEAVSPYQSVRRTHFRNFIPPSTSVVMGGLALPGAEMEIQALAALARASDGPQAFDRDDLRAAPTSGYAPAVRHGDFVFAAGVLAMAPQGETTPNGLAREANMPPGNLWRGTHIQLETDYIVGQRIKPVLEMSGASLANIVKAQVYMTHTEDFAGFAAAWSRYFDNAPPVTTLVPCARPGLAVHDGRIEINVIALADDSRLAREIVPTEEVTGYDHNSAAIRVGDMLFLSGLMAVDGDGLLETCRVDPRQPWFQSSVAAQADAILDKAARICEAAGTSLANVVRAQHFLSDLGDFHSVYEAWARHTGGRPLPFSAVKVGGEMPVPGCRLIADLWVYAP